MVRKADMPIQKLTPEIITAAILGFEEQKRHIDSQISVLKATEMPAMRNPPSRFSGRGVRQIPTATITAARKTRTAIRAREVIRRCTSVPSRSCTAPSGQAQ